MSDNKLSILIYHRVLNEFDPFNSHEAYRSSFDQQMKWVKRFFNVLPLEEAVSRLKEDSLPPRALSITFDDGYKDNYTNALPILQKHGLSATFYVSTGFLNGGIMWNDAIIEAFRDTKADILDLGAYGIDVCPLGDDKGDRLHGFIEKVKFLPFEKRLEAIKEIQAQLKVAAPKNLMMNDNEVRALAEAGMEIGGHTVNHPILSRLSNEEARKEIAQGKAQLESIVQKKLVSFAYPNGKPGRDYHKEHVNLVREAGFEIAVSTAWGVASSESDLLQLPRFTPWDKRIGKFMFRLYRNGFSSKEESV